MPKRIYPGRRTLQEWRALPRQQREDLADRARCDLLGSFRHCNSKRCRRARTCSGKAADCWEKLWRQTKPKPKRLRNADYRLRRLPNA